MLVPLLKAFQKIGMLHIEVVNKLLKSLHQLFIHISWKVCKAKMGVNIERLQMFQSTKNYPRNFGFTTSQITSPFQSPHFVKCSFMRAHKNRQDLCKKPLIEVIDRKVNRHMNLQLSFTIRNLHQDVGLHVIQIQMEENSSIAIGKVCKPSQKEETRIPHYINTTQEWKRINVLQSLKP